MKNLKLGRRGFFGLLASAPVAAKAAVDDAAASLMKINPTGLGSTDILSPPPLSPFGSDPAEFDRAVVAASNYARVAGLPRYAQQRLREDTKFVYALDPDIAAKRSWSMSVKIQTQRERNYRRRCEEIHRAALHVNGKKAFMAITGWEWPWS